jgi:hypothetical protein
MIEKRDNNKYRLRYTYKEFKQLIDALQALDSATCDNLLAQTITGMDPAIYSYLEEISMWVLEYVG